MTGDDKDGPKGPKAPHQALKDALKAVAADPAKPPPLRLATPADATDPDRTTLIGGRGAGVIQDALKLVEGHAPGRLGKPIERDAANPPSKGKLPDEMKNETPPTLAIRGERRIADAKTQALRGPRKPSRSEFHQEPVVGWLVVIGGPGLGAFRAVYEGNNTIGRAPTQRIAIDFGDDAISAEEQAYLRYDSTDRQFLFVPNMAKTNVVAVNDLKPTAAVKLSAMDVITMGQTQVVFVPFCGDEFDWSELKALNE